MRVPRFALRDSVCGGLLRVSLEDGNGKLPNVGLLALAARGALLADLVRLGILSRSADGLQLDTVPTGCMVADQLAREVERHPDRTLDRWLRRGIPHLDAMAWELVHTGCWAKRFPGPARMTSYFTDLEPAGTREVSRAVRSALRGEVQSLDGGGAGLILIYAALQRPRRAGQPRPSAPPWVERALGELDWIVRGVVFEIERRSELAEFSAQGTSDG